MLWLPSISSSAVELSTARVRFEQAIALQSLGIHAKSVGEYRLSLATDESLKISALWGYDGEATESTAVPKFCGMANSRMRSRNTTLSRRMAKLGIVLMAHRQMRSVRPIASGLRHERQNYDGALKIWKAWDRRRS